jgi:hypothetical protein
LRTELAIENGIVIFQLLAALDRFDEPAIEIVDKMTKCN